MIDPRVPALCVFVSVAAPVLPVAIRPVPTPRAGANVLAQASPRTWDGPSAQGRGNGNGNGNVGSGNGNGNSGSGNGNRNRSDGNGNGLRGDGNGNGRGRGPT